MFFVAHLIAIAILKQNVSKDFQNVNLLDKILHCVECISFAYPLYDWDFKKRGGVNENYERMKNVHFEGAWNIFINLIFSCCHLVLLIFLSKYHFKHI